jgi:hypothetical protein
VWINAPKTGAEARKLEPKLNCCPTNLEKRTDEIGLQNAAKTDGEIKSCLVARPSMIAKTVRFYA